MLYEMLSGGPAHSERAYHHRVARAVVCLDTVRARTSGGVPKDLPATGQRLLGQFLLERDGALGSSLLAKVKVAEDKDRERSALLTTPLK